ncbi:hypothetical protein CPB85DRAFT_1302451 [Mucidula mucida]|nr:hypothetical protein CPB85DRAFT_1302451 [Mucidula mucida]
MSDFPSPSPHTNLPDNPSSSRTPTHDRPVSARPSAEDPSQSSTQTRPPIHHSHYIEDPLSSASSASPRTRRRPASSDAPDERMSKRMRRPSPQPKSRSRASSSESQGGMADTEEAEPSHHSQRTPPPTNPQKKKRTRTLTTPHQSAVLHALLAQSRFPTTAMREEVGRSIGLSARKVQIWFQNQRQKARRPRTQGELPLTRPPQYGPYPSTGDSVSLGPAPGSASQSHSPQYGQYPRGGYAQAPGGYDYPPVADPYYATSVELSTQLLGPGMPGRAGPSGYQSSSPQRSPDEGRFLSPRRRPYPDPRLRSPSPPRRRPSDPYAHPLPSIPFGSARGPGMERPYVLRRTPSPSLTLPPLFPLQPPPPPPLSQWDPPRLAPLIPPPSEAEVTLSPIRTGHVSDEPINLPSISARGTTDEPLPSLRMEERFASPRPQDPPPPRPAGRYDPVRATVIPYRRDPTPPPRNPSREEPRS